jgi:SAM-dependent methyltransferase
VLDVGCGPAFVLEALARKGVRSAVGVDVSARLIEAGRARLAGRGAPHAPDERARGPLVPDEMPAPPTPPVELIALDRERPTDLAALGDRRFSVVVCNSVVQYLRDAAEAEALLRSILGICAPGARVLVADLVVGGGRVADAGGLLRGAWRRGRLGEAWRRLFAMRRSSYAATRARLGLLAVDPEALAAVARSLGADARVLREPLTMLANRRHLFVQTTT